MKFIFLVGPHACGKTYSSEEYVNANNDSGMIDTGPIMRKLHNNSNPNISIGTWIRNLEEKYGNNITSDLISNEIEKIISNSECENFILIGFRTLEGIFYTINHLDLDNYSILYVDAPTELLYSNFLSREKKSLSYEEFQDYLCDELNSGLKSLKEIALSDADLIDYYFRSSNNDSVKGKFDMHFNKLKEKKLIRNNK